MSGRALRGERRHVGGAPQRPRAGRCPRRPSGGLPGAREGCGCRRGGSMSGAAESLGGRLVKKERPAAGKTERRHCPSHRWAVGGATTGQSGDAAPGCPWVGARRPAEGRQVCTGSSAPTGIGASPRPPATGAPHRRVYAPTRAALPRRPRPGAPCAGQSGGAAGRPAPRPRPGPARR